ncbi:MAG: energy transducer TonB [Oxalobacter sp.]|nr:energy transducer TonB [Oxalobacter sp.]
MTMDSAVSFLHPCDDICRLRPISLVFVGMVLSVHVFALFLLAGRMPQVEAGGSSGRGGSALYVSFLSGNASAVSTAAGTVTAESAGIPKGKQEKAARPVAASQDTGREVRVETGKATDKPSEPKTEEGREGIPVETEEKGGRGKGTGKESAGGTGRGNGADAGGDGDGAARQVSFSQIRYKQAVKPVYPPASIRRKETGLVQVRVLIGADGRVQDARITASSGFARLDQSALEAAMRSSFYPYAEYDRPLQVVANIPYQFNLKTR